MASPSSGVTAEALRSKLTTSLSASHVEIHDESGGCGQAFTSVIVSGQFEKKTQLARHRLVNGLLKEEISAIHAWSARCYTEAEWEKVRAETGGG